MLVILSPSRKWAAWGQTCQLGINKIASNILECIYLGGSLWGICTECHATPWARAANFVKKPPLIVNITYSELNGFNASMWVSWSLTDPKKSQCIDQCIQIHQICVHKKGYNINIKFEVSLHFWPIWPTVCHAWLSWWYTTRFSTLCTWFPTSSQ